MAANTVSLKLLVDSTSQRVLFAESGKDFVDFMFNILSLPIGSVIKLLTKEQMVGSLGNLYGSLENMNDTYSHSPENKDTLLKPIVPNNAANVPPLLPTLEFSKPIEIYRCGNYLRRNCGLYVSGDSKFICPSCNNVMNQTVTNVNPKKKDSSTNEGGKVPLERILWQFTWLYSIVNAPSRAVSTERTILLSFTKEYHVLAAYSIENSFVGMALGPFMTALKIRVIPYMQSVANNDTPLTFALCKYGVKLLRASLQSKGCLLQCSLGRK
ncbi:hypothetical protein Gogos_020710 [Gossypium gossypioides]|uniref:Uncharacterized protein n=1 Tax=Gossypium gossypioides TaxID=34282 RepID=A0A7J9D306_GOSGO|nr:hypothetical protein [Gossypium gossypioides]